MMATNNEKKRYVSVYRGHELASALHTNHYITRSQNILKTRQALLEVILCDVLVNNQPGEVLFH